MPKGDGGNDKGTDKGVGNDHRRCHHDCCKVDVCLNFVDATCTHHFEEAMREMFTRIFDELCDGGGRHRDDNPV